MLIPSTRNPNPVVNRLTIENNSASVLEEITIFDITGKEVFCAKLMDVTIDLSEISSGMYIVELVSDDWVVRKKLLVR